MPISLIIATAAAATAEAVAPGASSASGWISGDTLTTILSILAGCGGVLGGKIWGEKSARKVRAEIPQPCEVRKVADCVKVEDCNRRMKDMDERLTRIETNVADGMKTVLDKLAEIDKQGEQRANDIHRRLDRVVETTSTVKGEVEIIKSKVVK